MMTTEMLVKLYEMKKEYSRRGDAQAISLIDNTINDPKSDMRDVSQLEGVLSLYYGYDGSPMRMYEKSWPGYLRHKAINEVEKQKPQNLSKAMETALYLSECGLKNYIIIAGILHTGLGGKAREQLNSIREQFGEEVYDILTYFPDYLEKPLGDRSCLIDLFCDDMTLAEEVILLAETVTDLKELEQDFEMNGETEFKDLKGKIEMEEYYLDMQDALWERQWDERTRDLYWVMVNTFKRIFAKYYINGERETLYQVYECQCWKYEKKSPDWVPCDKPFETEKVYVISQEMAEETEDRWENRNECFKGTLHGERKSESEWER